MDQLSVFVPLNSALAPKSSLIECNLVTCTVLLAAGAQTCHEKSQWLRYMSGPVTLQLTLREAGRGRGRVLPSKQSAAHDVAVWGQSPSPLLEGSLGPPASRR